MKQQKRHRIVALTLAVLVFISTTGVGITLGWCHCTNQAIASIFVPSECCSHQVVQPVKDACCAKTAAAINAQTPSISAQKCCDTVFKYTTADIDFTNWVEGQVPTINWTVWIDVPQLVYHQVVANLFTFVTTYKANPNKAPPVRLFGKILLQFIQIYRC